MKIKIWKHIENCIVTEDNLSRNSVTGTGTHLKMNWIDTIDLVWCYLFQTPKIKIEKKFKKKSHS